MQAPLAPLLLSALLSAGCARSVTAAPLAAAPLLGPYPSRDDACRALVTSGAREGWRSASCTITPSELSEDAPMRAAVLMVRDAAALDPRLAAAGAYFLGISAGAAWFMPDRSLDEVNGAAGHTYLPVVTPEGTALVKRSGSGVRVLFRFRDAVDSVCNACEGPQRDERTPVAPRLIVTVCGRVGSGKPQCTPPLRLDPQADVSLSDDVLTVREPGKPRALYALSF